VKQLNSNLRHIPTGCSRNTGLSRRNRELQAQVAALIEDNKQLRAALQIFSEVARQSPAVLPLNRVA
jgi:hypothetical protein